MAFYKGTWTGDGGSLGAPRIIGVGNGAVKLAAILIQEEGFPLLPATSGPHIMWFTDPALVGGGTDNKNPLGTGSVMGAVTANIVGSFTVSPELNLDARVYHYLGWTLGAQSFTGFYDGDGAVTKDVVTVGVAPSFVHISNIGTNPPFENRAGVKVPAIHSGASYRGHGLELIVPGIEMTNGGLTLTVSNGMNVLGQRYYYMMFAPASDFGVVPYTGTAAEQTITAGISTPNVAIGVCASNQQRPSHIQWRDQDTALLTRWAEGNDDGLIFGGPSHIDHWTTNGVVITAAAGFAGANINEAGIAQAMVFFRGALAGPGTAPCDLDTGEASKMNKLVILQLPTPAYPDYAAFNGTMHEFIEFPCSAIVSETLAAPDGPSEIWDEGVMCVTEDNHAQFGGQNLAPLRADVMLPVQISKSAAGNPPNARGDGFTAGNTFSRLGRILEQPDVAAFPFDIIVQTGLQAMPGTDTHRIETVEPLFYRHKNYFAGGATAQVSVVYATGLSQILTSGNEVSESTAITIQNLRPGVPPVPVTKATEGIPDALVRFAGSKLTMSSDLGRLVYVGSILRGRRVT
jgi:hypothetical protein